MLGSKFSSSSVVDEFIAENKKEFSNQYYDLVYRLIFSDKTFRIVALLCIYLAISGYLKSKSWQMIPAQLIILFFFTTIRILYTRGYRKIFKTLIFAYPYAVVLSWCWEYRLFTANEGNYSLYNTPILLIIIWLFSYSPSQFKIFFNCVISSAALIAFMNFENGFVFRKYDTAAPFICMGVGLTISLIIQGLIKREFYLNHQSQMIFDSESERRIMLENIPLGILSIEKKEGNLMLGKNFSKFLPETLRIKETTRLGIDEFLSLLGLNASDQHLVKNVLEATVGENAISWEMNYFHLPLSTHYILTESSSIFFRLSWTPQLANGIVEKIFITISDETSLVKATKLASENEVKLKMVGELITSDAQKINSFLCSASQSFDEVSFLIREPSILNLKYASRLIHTLKGDSRTLGLQSLTEELHAFEETLGTNLLLDKIFHRIRSKVDAYEHLHKEVLGGQPRSGRAFIDEQELRLAIDNTVLDPHHHYIVKPATSFLADLACVRNIDKLCAGINRLVRIVIRNEGYAHFIDIKHSQFFESIMGQLISNSLSHGIESPERRMQEGKDPQGTLTLTLMDEGLLVEDDGQGLDLDLLVQKASMQDVRPRDSLSREQVAAFIFQSGITTAPELTLLSGRGIGLEAVKTMVEEAGGRIDLILRDAAPFQTGQPFALFLSLPRVIRADSRPGSVLTSEWSISPLPC